MDLDQVPGDSVADLVRMPDPNANTANRHRGKPLENLLMAKNRKLQDELTGLRVRHSLSPQSSAGTDEEDRSRMTSCRMPI